MCHCRSVRAGGVDRAEAETAAAADGSVVIDGARRNINMYYIIKLAGRTGFPASFLCGLKAVMQLFQKIDWESKNILDKDGGVNYTKTDR